ncbi:peptidoglycan/LPS O-acetylase OafA/YrhL [Azospirillum sp. OGB3]|uniref:acyltransferase n=1 Tax=Azospirillum sp. OGB3 TaxID=2587012 RepID=UPI0016067D2A|nr:acyltransferase [Azospirillum sp. OGB3]MBB3268187.1 peptidoglycan/LPS O-acetylase OafA/YrhL [Azospirillum sp. OGB3]
MGFLRLYLSLVVVVSHLGSVPFFPAFDPGMAVFCFFIISGYYAAYALNEVYVGNGSVKRYYLNRVIRLWPIYAVSILILWPTGLVHQVFSRAMELPTASTVAVVVSNVLIVGIDVFSHISLAPSDVFIAPFGTASHNGSTYILNLPAWSLSIELLFYAVAPFVVRDVKRSVVFTICGLLFCVFWKYNQGMFSGLRPDLFYTHFMVYFGLGSSSYWLIPSPAEYDSCGDSR